MEYIRWSYLRHRVQISSLYLGCGFQIKIIHESPSKVHGVGCSKQGKQPVLLGLVV